MYGEMRSRFNATIKEWTRAESRLQILEGELEEAQKLVPETPEQERERADMLELLGKEIDMVKTSIRILDSRAKAIEVALDARRTR